MKLVLLIKCQMCGFLNGFWIKHCRDCGRDRAFMDWLASECKAAEDWYQEYVLRAPGDYPE